jgi:plastocyanin
MNKVTRTRIVLVALVLMLGVGALLMAPGAGAAKKPPKNVVTACKSEMQEANRVVAHSSELAALLGRQPEAVDAFLGKTSPTDADVQALLNELKSVTQGSIVLVPQLRAAIATHQIQRAQCLKGLGLKEAQVAPPVPTTGALTGFGSGDGAGGTADAPAKPDTITIKDFSFAPEPLTVKAGTTITVSNADGFTHTVTAVKGTFDTGDVAGGGTAQFTVDQPGTYAYFCNTHPSMKGTIQVD